jgi:hypothetical protein
MIVRSLIWFVLLCCMSPGRGVAQAGAPPPADSAHALLVISSSPESAWVMLDTAIAGQTPCSLAVPAPARVHLRIQHPDIANWLTGTVDDTLAVHGGEIIRRAYTLETRTLVVSSPMGAEVFDGDSLLGSTPLVLQRERVSPTSELTLRLRGYERAAANPGMASRGVLRVPLRARMDPATQPDRALLTDSRPSPTRLYLTGGGAILAGAAAAYFKTKADNTNNDYLLTRDPALASKRNRFDTTSGVFLVVTQVSLGLFLAFLLSE